MLEAIIMAVVIFIVIRLMASKTKFDKTTKTLLSAGAAISITVILNLIQFILSTILEAIF